MADDTYSRGHRNDPYGRDGTGASGQSTDPLTELARLIGQSDPFGAGPDRRPDPRAPESAAPQAWPADEPAHPPQYQDQHAPAYDGHGTPEPHYADGGYGSRETYPPEGGHAATEPYDQGYERGYGDQPFHGDRSHQTGQHVQPAAAGYAAAGYDTAARGHGDHQGQGHEAPYFGANEHGPGQDDEFYEEDEPAPRRRGGLITVAALVGLAVIGSAGAFAYRTVFTGPGGAPPVIRSDGGPNKIVPTTQNTDSASSKQIYDRMVDRGQNERVVSREEQPLSIPDPARNPPRVAGPASGPPLAAPPAQPPLTSDTSALAPAQGEPKKIRTVTIKADQSGEPARPATPPRTAAPAAPAPRAGAPAPASPNAPLSLAPQQDIASAAAPPPQAVRPSPPPQVARASPPPHRPAPAPTESQAGGGFFVQLTAQKTEEEAQSSFRGIQAKYASVLSGRQPVIRRKDLGSRGVFYGAQVGPFSRDDAVQLCESLKSAGASCMVQRN